MADKNYFVELVIGAKDRASRTVDKLGRALGRLNNRVTQVGLAIATYFTAKAGIDFFSGAIDSEKQFEEQLKRVQAATGATADEMAVLQDAADQAGTTTRYTATQAAQALETLGRAGINAAESAKLLPTVLNLAQGASIDLASAAGIVTDSLGAFGKGAEDAGKFADVLTQGARIANTDVQKLGLSLSYAGVQASQMGYSVEQTTALLDALANAGIRGERAGSALRNILGQISNPASTAIKELQKLGISSGNLIDVIDGLNQAGPKATAAINAFGLEAGPALRTLLQSGSKGIQEFTAQLENSAGVAKATAKTMDDNLVGATKGLASAWDAVRRTIIKPLFAPLTEEVRKLTTGMRDFVKGGQATEFGNQIADAFKSAVKAIKDFVRQAGGVKGATDTIGEGAKNATSALASLASNTRKIGAGIRLVFNTISVGLKGLYVAFVGFVSGVSKASSGLISLFQQVGIGERRLFQIQNG